MKTFNLKTAFEKLNIKPVDLNNISDEPEIIKFNLSILRYRDVLIIEDRRDYEFAWMLLSNDEAKKHRNEFSENPALLKLIDSGKDVFVMPETSQHIFGFYYRKVSDLVGDHFANDDRKVKHIVRVPTYIFARCETIRDIFREYDYFKEYR